MLIAKFDTTNVEKDLVDFEVKYGINLPRQYGEFILKYNGGRTPKTNFKINRISSDLRALYGIGEVSEYYSFTSLERIKVLKDYLEDGMLPIGTNVFGDKITIGIGNENYGKIFFLYHDRARRFRELCDDFNTFINKCKSEKMGHIESIEERKTRLKANGNGKNITPGLVKAWQEEIDLYGNMVQEKVVLTKE